MNASNNNNNFNTNSQESQEGYLFKDEDIERFAECEGDDSDIISELGTSLWLSPPESSEASSPIHNETKEPQDLNTEQPQEPQEPQDTELFGNSESVLSEQEPPVPENRNITDAFPHQPQEPQPVQFFDGGIEEEEKEPPLKKPKKAEKFKTKIRSILTSATLKNKPKVHCCNFGSSYRTEHGIKKFIEFHLVIENFPKYIYMALYVTSASFDDKSFFRANKTDVIREKTYTKLEGMLMETLGRRHLVTNEKGEQKTYVPAVIEIEKNPWVRVQNPNSTDEFDRYLSLSDHDYRLNSYEDENVTYTDTWGKKGIGTRPVHDYDGAHVSIYIPLSVFDGYNEILSACLCRTIEKAVYHEILGNEDRCENLQSYSLHIKKYYDHNEKINKIKEIMQI